MPVPSFLGQLSRKDNNLVVHVGRVWGGVSPFGGSARGCTDREMGRGAELCVRCWLNWDLGGEEGQVLGACASLAKTLVPWVGRRARQHAAGLGKGKFKKKKKVLRVLAE